MESAIGAHLANAAALHECELFYWRDAYRAVDFVGRTERMLTAIEPKSNRSRDNNPGLVTFAELFKPTRQLLAGGNAVPVEEFLLKPVRDWVAR